MLKGFSVMYYITIITCSVVVYLALSRSSIAAAQVDELMPEFAGRGNIMGGAEFCSFSERHAFRAQTMHLIKESGLSASDQARLIKAFDIEHRDGIDFYRQAQNRKETCDAIKDGLALMSEEEIRMWKLMAQSHTENADAGR